MKNSKWLVRRGAALLYCAVLWGARLEGEALEALDSPLILNPGQWQVESTWVQYAREGSRQSSVGERTHTWSWGETVFGYGWGAGMDLQLQLEPYIEQTQRLADGSAFRQRGVGDLTLRLRHTLFHSAASGVSWAMLPYLKLPTAAKAIGNGAWEGGLLFPHKHPLTEKWTLAAWIGVGWEHAGSETPSRSVIVPYAAFELEAKLREGLDFYLRFESAADPDAAPRHWEMAGGGGLALALSPVRELNLEVLIGITRPAPDLAISSTYNMRW